MSTALWKLLKTRPVAASVSVSTTESTTVDPLPLPLPMNGVKISIRGSDDTTSAQLASYGVSETERELLGMPLEIIDWTSESNVDRYAIESKLSAFLGVVNWSQHDNTTATATATSNARFISKNPPKKRVQLMILPSSGPAMLPEMMPPLPYPTLLTPSQQQQPTQVAPSGAVNKSGFATRLRKVLHSTGNQIMPPSCTSSTSSRSNTDAIFTKIMFDKINDYLNNMPVAYRGRVIYMEAQYETAVCASVSVVEGLFQAEKKNEEDDDDRVQVFILHFGNTTALSGFLGTCLDPFVRTNKHWTAAAGTPVGTPVGSHVGTPVGSTQDDDNATTTKWMTTDSDATDSDATANFDELNEDEQSEITDHVQKMIATKYVIVNLEDTQSTNAFMNMSMNGGVSIVVSDAHNLVRPVWDKLRQRIMDAKDARVILLTHLPSEREPCVLATLVNLAVGGNMSNSHDMTMTVGGAAAAPNKKHTQRLKRSKNSKYTLRKQSKPATTTATTTTNTFTFLPETPDAFNTLFVDTVGFNLTSVDTLRKRLTGIVSYLPCSSSVPPDIMPVRATTSPDENLYQIIPCPLTDFQQQAYLTYMKKQGRGTTSDGNDTIVEGQRICQFAYPTDIINISDEENTIKILRERMGDVFTAKQLADVYSPKYHEILARILHPGHVGCHMVHVEKEQSSTNFKLALEANGFVEMKLERKTNETSSSSSSSAGRLPWALAETSLMSPESPKFICFDTGIDTSFVEQSEILRALFNSEWENVPQNILDQLKQMYANSSMHNNGNTTADMDFTNNHYGQVVKVCVFEQDSSEYDEMQPQSTSSSLSPQSQSQSQSPAFKNTRFIHFIECSQNISRMDTIVNYVIHACSHANLPRDLQTVQTWVYVSIFGVGDNNNSSSIGINSLFDKVRQVTADEHVMEYAFAQYKIRQEIVSLFASIDG